MTVVVVGAAGGVGRRVLAHLNPGEALAVDRMSIPGDRLSIQCDMSDSAAVRDAALEVPPGSSCVFVAGRVADDAAEVADIVRDNIAGPAVFLAAVATRLSAFVLLSSVSVYGRQNALPISEDIRPAPTTLYGTSKAAGEALVHELAIRSGVPLAIMRSTQLYGVSSAASTLPHRLVAWLRRGEPPRVAADPETVRDYLHVDDLAELLIRAAHERRTGTINVGSGRARTLRQVVGAASAAFGVALDEGAVFAEATTSDSQLLDVSRAREILGFEPRIQLEEWFRLVAAGAEEFSA